MPVVANGLPVLREVLSVDGAPCAEFVDATDVAAFAAAMTRVLTDPALATTLSATGRQLEKKYSLDAMVEGYVKIMRDLDVASPAGSGGMTTVPA
ncbi:glycosyltransferase [Methylobrevis pamukkalensis]|uniref:D-inositol-3-phosphate glycosyltransferase n=1 Tax=Methylobrevis pamukkalensis TaxID=1439726 RepID=A0A1E3H5F9_9HYPH|nr:hypothetical protein [Methylobrevis pamukkalensis]ODN71385.1 hypothetical protein A6302_01249 [Methylobrevis pamukkalensis]